MKFAFRFALFAAVLTLPFAFPASAQYMYMDTNANGIHDAGDKLNANNDLTLVDIYLNTNVNRNGTTAVCDVAAATARDISSYAVNMLASGGTVTYGTFINRQSATMSIQLQVVNPGDGVTYKNGFFGIAYIPAGLYRLGTLTITGRTGTPGIDFVDLAAGSVDFTSFGTPCRGFFDDNTYRLDGPNTRGLQGTADWFDADGLPGTPTAISVALQDAQAEVGLVRLRWVVPDARTTVCTVQRRSAASDWADLGLADVESGGVVRYEDRSVTPGERYAYRLFVQSARDRGYSNEVWILVP